MDEDTWPSFIHFTSNYRANQGGRERERERWPFDCTLSFNTRRINAPRSDGGSNLSSLKPCNATSFGKMTHAIIHTQHTLITPFLSFSWKPHILPIIHALSGLLWRIPTFKSLLCWLTFCHCFLFFITIIIIIIMDSCTLQLTNSTYLQPLSLSLSLSIMNSSPVFFDYLTKNTKWLSSLESLFDHTFVLTSWTIQNFRYTLLRSLITVCTSL